MTICSTQSCGGGSANVAIDPQILAALITPAPAAGLRYRPMTDTIRGAAAWWQSLPAERREKNRFSYKPDVEAAALKAWRAKRRGDARNSGLPGQCARGGRDLREHAAGVPSRKRSHER